MDKVAYITAVEEALMNLLGVEDEFWNKQDEFAHYARIIKEASFLDSDMKDVMKNALHLHG